MTTKILNNLIWTQLTTGTDWFLQNQGNSVIIYVGGTAPASADNVGINLHRGESLTSAMVGGGTAYAKGSGIILVKE